jgi:autotransporter-associated beta strand protein
MKGITMKHRNIFSIALIVCLLLLLTLAPTTNAQSGGRRAVVRTGVFRLGAGQMLRLTIDGQSNTMMVVQFRRTYYAGSTSGGIWKTTNVVAQDTSAPITIAPNEAASIDAGQGGFDAVRIEAVISGYTGTTHVNGGTLQVINSDGSVASATSLLATTFGG